MPTKLVGSYNIRLIKRDKFINKVLKSFRKQLIKLLPEENYELMYEDILESVKELLTGK